MKKYALPGPYFKFYTGLVFSRPSERKYSAPVYTKYPRFKVIFDRRYVNILDDMKFMPAKKPYIKLRDRIYFMPRNPPCV